MPPVQMKREPELLTRPVKLGRSMIGAAQTNFEIGIMLGPERPTRFDPEQPTRLRERPDGAVRSVLFPVPPIGDNPNLATFQPHHHPSVFRPLERREPLIRTPVYLRARAEELMPLVVAAWVVVTRVAASRAAAEKSNLTRYSL